MDAPLPPSGRITNHFDSLQKVMFWCEPDLMILVRLDGVLCQKERIFPTTYFYSRWPRDRKGGPVTAPLLRLQVRISTWKWISVSCVCYVLRYRCYQWTRGVLHCVAHLSVIVKLRKGGGPAPLANVAHVKKKEKQEIIFQLFVLWSVLVLRNELLLSNLVYVP